MQAGFTRASNIPSEARRTYHRFRPHFVIGDKGYSGEPLMHLIRRQYKSQPIIDVPSNHKKLMAAMGEAFKTPEWKALYRQRGAVERVNSRLKGQRSLNRITTRGLRKVTVHCYLALIALQVVNITAL